MKELLIYALEVLVCSAALLLAYSVLLERRTAFLHCRLYLIGAMLLAALIPALSIPVSTGETLYMAADPVAAAARIVASSPAWKAGTIDGEPVRVRYTLPVRCGKQVAADETDDRGKRSENGVVVKVRNADFKASEALIFIDDKEATQTDMEKIDPDKIERISVYRDSSAVVRYGERGKNGVILIKMKQ